MEMYRKLVVSLQVPVSSESEATTKLQSLLTKLKDVDDLETSATLLSKVDVPPSE